MKKRDILIVFFAFLVSTCVVFAQKETCETPQNTVNDLNSITKCTIEKKESNTASGKKSRQLSVRVSSSRRFLKRRSKQKASGIGALNTSGVDAKEDEIGISNNVLSVNEASTISKLKEKISKEQLRTALAFEEVDQIPLFTTCNPKNLAKDTDCFDDAMVKHISEHFRYPDYAILNKIEGNVWIRFVIDEEGNITNLKTLAPKNADVLKQEAERVVSKLKPFKPAEKNGKKVITKYGFPINFSLED